MFLLADPRGMQPAHWELAPPFTRLAPPAGNPGSATGFVTLAIPLDDDSLICECLMYFHQSTGNTLTKF